MDYVTQARIALLEGERRSFENIRLDLARRIKMLEYALRMERCVILHIVGPGCQSLPSSLQNQAVESSLSACHILI